MTELQTHHIQDKETWEQLVQHWPESNFLQSWNWGVFQQKMGKTVLALSFHRDQQYVAAALCVREAAKRGTYLTIAGGPLLNWNDEELVTVVMQELKKVALSQKCTFVRFRPQAIETTELLGKVKKTGCLPAPMHLTADLTLQLDLHQSEEELLAQMRKNTRYEVRRAEKLGITVRTSTDPAEIEPFYKQQLEVAQKHGFVPFGYKFLMEQFSTFVADGQACLFHAYQGNDILASAFILCYHGEAVYHYGVSTPANAKLPGSYACQWAAIRWAKAQGATQYNFWGIAPEGQLSHRFAGVSLFKRGFGGTEVQYLPAQDLPVSWSYPLVRGFETIRRKMRRL